MSVTLAEKDAFVLAVLADSSLTPTARFVATVLAIRFLNRKTLRCDPAYETIGQAIGAKRRMTILAIEELEAAEWIKVERRGGRHRPNLFELRFDRLEKVHHSAPFVEETVHHSAPFKADTVHPSAPFEAERVHPSAPEPTDPSGLGERVPTRAPGGRGFEEFWRVYPKRVGHAKARLAFEAVVASGKLTPAALVAAAERYAAERAGQEARWTLTPANWLDGERWLDELAPPRTPGGSGRPGTFSFMDYARQTAGRSNR